MVPLKQKPDPTWMEKIPPRLAAQWGLLPIYIQEDGAVAVLVRESHNLQALENLNALLNRPLAYLPCSAPDFQKTLQENFGLGAESIDEIPDSSGVGREEAYHPENNEAAIARFVADLIRQAHRDRATDIHIEPFDQEILIRFRIDGILHEVKTPGALAKFRNLLASRIKLMAQMNIAEKRLPQDGRIRFQSPDDELDIRVSTLPTISGESIDLRILPRTRLILGPEELGMSKSILETISRLIQRPNGILLVTGPTGHGKTTTLYAFLSRINSVDKKIITIEDPVEYRLRGVNQIQAHPKIGLTFAHGLRSILRQDPDIIMVGEIRDKETSEIAIRSSLTGHLVFSTLHTNDAIGAVTRLIDMGIEPYLVASSLNGVLAQRLVRLICKNCRGENKTCTSCRGTGFFGRTGIFELFEVNEEIRNLILEQAPAALLRDKARSAGMKSLYQDGKGKADRGLTRLDEVSRVAEEVA